MNMEVGYGCCFGCSGLDHVFDEIFSFYTLIILLWGSSKLGAGLVILYGILEDAFDWLSRK
jgi:hypothetical protein